MSSVPCEARKRRRRLRHHVRHVVHCTTSVVNRRFTTDAMAIEKKLSRNEARVPPPREDSLDRSRRGNVRAKRDRTRSCCVGDQANNASLAPMACSDMRQTRRKTNEGGNVRKELYDNVGTSNKANSSTMDSSSRSSCDAKIHEPCHGNTFTHETNEWIVASAMVERRPDTTRDNTFQTLDSAFTRKENHLYFEYDASRSGVPQWLHSHFACTARVVLVAHVALCIVSIPNLCVSNEKGGIRMDQKGGIRCEWRPRQLRRVHQRRHVVLFAALASASEDVCDELPELEEEKTR